MKFFLLQIEKISQKTKLNLLMNDISFGQASDIPNLEVEQDGSAACPIHVAYTIVR